MRNYVLLACATASALPAHAQSAPTPLAAPASNNSAGTASVRATSAVASSSAGEIVVTAQRREERLKDVPIAITALSGATLTSAGITSAQNLGLVTPGLNYAVQGAYAQPVIRGVGTSLAGPGADANVALYVDGLYQPSQISNLFDFNNIERIEVLKGPQGTLFGRNSTGGAIRVITKDPGDLLTGNVGVSYGRFNEVKANAYVNVPLGNGIAFNLAGIYNRSDGYLDNVTLDEKNKSQVYALRGKLRLDLTDTLRFVLAGNYANLNDPTPFYVRPVDGNNITKQQGVVFPRGFYDVALDQRPEITNKVYSLSATGTLRAANGTLTSITGYQHFEPNLIADADNSPLFIATADLPTREKTFSQEANYASAFSGPLNFTAGVFYYRDTYDQAYIGTSGSVPPPYVTASIVTSVKTQALSGYTEVTYKPTERVQLTGGLRYSTERKHFVGGLPELTLVNQAKRWNSWTPRAVIRYTLDSNSNVYASYSRGFKSGNFNALFLSPVPVNPEKIDAYEIGYKRSVHGFAINTSAFYYNYSNIQVQTQTNSGGTIGIVYTNAASARIYGADLDVTVPVTNSLRLQGGLAYTHARYLDFNNTLITTPLVDADGVPIGGNSQVAGDASGNRLERAPEFTANLTSTYTTPLANGTAQLSATGSYNGAFYWDTGNNVRQGSYFILNARASWLSPDKHYRLSVFGENLANQKYYFYVNPTTLGNGGAPAKPWSVGIGANVYF